MLLLIGSVASTKSTDTIENFKKRINHFLDYAATQPNAKLKYFASAMKLWVESNALYLFESRAHSRAGGILHLRDKPKFSILPDPPRPTSNGHILVISKIIDAVMSSTQEDKNGTRFIAAKKIIPCRIILVEMSHKQRPTPLQFYKKCATGIMNDEIRQKLPNAWICDPTGYVPECVKKISRILEARYSKRCRLSYQASPNPTTHSHGAKNRAKLHNNTV